MTDMTILTALDHIDSAIKYRFGAVEPKRLTEPESRMYPSHERAAQHIKFMINETRRLLAEHPEKREKIMRWLAFCQGWIWTMGIVSIDDLKDANRPPDE
jgi:hypothetical protein